MPYDWSTRWAGVFERHADFCPFSDGEMCTCGPLGYIAGIQEPGSGERVSSPMLDSLEEARAWRREQEWAVGPQHAPEHGHRNGNGNGKPTSRMSIRPDEQVVEQVGRQARRRVAGSADEARVRRGPRVVAPPRSGRNEFQDPPREHQELRVSALVEKFLDAAE